MTDFIYYMPLNNELNNEAVRSKEEGELNMILKFDKYLKELKNIIENGKIKS